MSGILAATRRGLESQCRYHSDSSIDSTIGKSMSGQSDSDWTESKPESSSTSFTDDDTDSALPDYSFDAATNDMTWDLIQSPPRSPPTRRPSHRWINRNYHIFCVPKMSRRDICDDIVQRRDLSPFRERGEYPQRVKIFEDDTLADAQPLPSDSLSSFYNCFESISSPESMDFDCNSDFDSFGPHRTSTPTIEPAPTRPASASAPTIESAPTRPAKRRLSFNNKENEPSTKERRDNSDAGDAFVNHAIIIRQYCEFCWANNESPLIYTFHTLTDKKGRTLCPVLRQLVCPICNADGDNAHTTDRCPQLNRQQELQPLGQHNSRERERRGVEARDREREGNSKMRQPLGSRSPSEVQRAPKRPAPDRSPAGVRHVRRKLTLLEF